MKPLSVARVNAAGAATQLPPERGSRTCPEMPTKPSRQRRHPCSCDLASTSTTTAVASEHPAGHDETPTGGPRRRCRSCPARDGSLTIRTAAMASKQHAHLVPVRPAEINSGDSPLGRCGLRPDARWGGEHRVSSGSRHACADRKPPKRAVRSRRVRRRAGPGSSRNRSPCPARTGRCRCCHTGPDRYIGAERHRWYGRSRYRRRETAGGSCSARCST